MRKPESYICDGCPEVRGPGNHWMLHLAGDDSRSPIFKPWDNQEAIGTGHVCGQACACKLLSQWFQAHHGNVGEDL